jgi:4-aminobutyrate aminotransferase-like enzyme
MDTPERKATLVKVARDEYGLLLLGAGNRSIRTRPNLSVTESDIDLFLALLDAAISKIS